MNADREPSAQGRTISYAAQQIGCCRRTADKLVKLGILRTYRVGRLRRCTDAAIAEAIKRLEAETP
jgi:excisionase family DNA binding protein